MGQHRRDHLIGCPARLIDTLESVTELHRRATGCLQEAGWTREQPRPTEDTLPSALRTAPETMIRWVSSFSKMSSSDDTVWFLSRDDYSARTDSAFAWNELEQMSIQAATTDDEAIAVSRFWQRHLPILLSVRHGYEYLAVRDDGAVVHGTEPEFEDAVVVFSHFDDLLRYIITRPEAREHVVERLLFDAPASPTRR